MNLKPTIPYAINLLLFSLFHHIGLQITPAELHSSDYDIISTDMRQLEHFTKHLECCHLDMTLPTLVVSECVLVYMEVQHSNNLLRWLADNIQTVFFVNYEQVK